METKKKTSTLIPVIYTPMARITIAYMTNDMPYGDVMRVQISADPNDAVYLPYKELSDIKISLGVEVEVRQFTAPRAYLKSMGILLEEKEDE